MLRKIAFTLFILVLFIPLGLSLAQDSETVTIQFWHTYNETSPENEMLVETLIPLFEEQNPGIRVESVPFPYGEFRQTMLTALAGEEGPDLARLDIIWSPEFAELGVLAALDEAMEDFQELAGRTFPGPLSTNAYGGHYYGLPLDTNTRVLMYNQNVYEAAGIDGPPETIEELAAQCEAVTALGDDYFVYSDGGAYGWAVLPWIWSFGGEIANEDMTEASGYINGPETVAAYEFLAEMVQSGCFSEGFIGSGIDTAASFFGGSTVGNMLEGPWWYPLAEAQYPDFEIQAALMPAGDGGSVSVVGGENIVMFAQTPNAEAAMTFLRFTQSDDYQLRMSETGQLTVIPELLETDYFQNHPYFGTFLEQLQTARARLPHPAWTEIESILTDAGFLILSGEAGAQEVLDEIAPQIDELLSE
jgi:multiple sugar transport system substrate-binding protein